MASWLVGLCPDRVGRVQVLAWLQVERKLQTVSTYP